MITVPALPAGPVLGAGWEVLRESRRRHSADLLVAGEGVRVEVRLERCAAGRLRDSYPVGAHDVEVRVGDDCPRALLPGLLSVLADAVLRADRECRRVVHAVPAGDPAARSAAEAAGFRYAVDVDLGRQELGLLVTEPDWVTGTDIDLDRVPGA
ncbi:hypothetical protein ABT301_10270 [Streptomyces sp. NPDC000987]|uniref:hypothetical protein n=1 Tax=Streptomyces sp. NPDC000987 TaxID=3154374 RepID=UPI0033177ECE